jgi:spore germination cell wall hydrolase CwlJ-like protein
MKTLTTIFIVLSVLMWTTASASSQTEYNKQLDCLAEAIYFESRGETFLGMLAVGTVIMNRVEHKEFPNTVCSVVYAGRHRNGKP